jgi:hypothetical protein
MASERQIAANLANALKSTGPRTAARRATSSRNAYRHGLSLPMAPDSELVESLARTLAGETAGKDQSCTRGPTGSCTRSGRGAARADADSQDQGGGDADRAASDAGSEGALTGLCAIGRYEGQALSRRKAAKRRLDEIDDGLG